MTVSSTERPATRITARIPPKTNPDFGRAPTTDGPEFKIITDPTTTTIKTTTTKSFREVLPRKYVSIKDVPKYMKEMINTEVQQIHPLCSNSNCPENSSCEFDQKRGKEVSLKTSNIYLNVVTFVFVIFFTFSFTQHAYATQAIEERGTVVLTTTNANTLRSVQSVKVFSKFAKIL